MATTTTTKMIGRRCPEGPGGRDCHCCGQAPGRGRKVARRTLKRAERHAWKQEARR